MLSGCLTGTKVNGKTGTVAMFGGTRLSRCEARCALTLLPVWDDVNPVKRLEAFMPAGNR